MNQDSTEPENKLDARKELTLEYYTLLTRAEAEQEVLKNAHQRQLEDLGARVRKSEDQLENQKKLSQKYHQALARAEAELQEKRLEINNLKDRLSLLQNRIIRKDHENARQLIKWITRLDKDFQALMQSRRWRLGNSLIGFFSRLIGRDREPESIQRMQSIFEQFRDRRRSVDLESMAKPDVKQLRLWMDQLEKDFRSLLKSRRLRLGNALGRPAGIIRGKFKGSKNIERMQKIFELYRSANN